jgi:hypothetical protein
MAILVPPSNERRLNYVHEFGLVVVGANLHCYLAWKSAATELADPAAAPATT